MRRALHITEKLYFRLEHTCTGVTAEMTELNYSTRFSYQRTRFSHMTSNQVFENCQLEKSHWKINHIVTIEYIILVWNQHSIFIYHYFNAKLFGICSKKSLTDVWQLWNSWPRINVQNNLTSNTAGISQDSRLKYNKITHRYAKDSPFTWFLYWKPPIDTDFIHFIGQFHHSVA